jgi:hypothetical protein
MLCGGPGPWFCSLLLNTSETSKKQTHLIAHTMPHLAVDIFNKSKTDKSYCWVILLKIGPFDVWSEAVAFLNLWTDKTRGKSRRLERGLELFSMYGNAHNLCLWGQTKTQAEILEEEAKQPPKKRAKKVAAPSGGAAGGVGAKLKKTKANQQQAIVWTRVQVQELFGVQQEELPIEQLRLMHTAVEKKRQK